VTESIISSDLRNKFSSGQRQGPRDGGACGSMWTLQHDPDEHGLLPVAGSIVAFCSWYSSVGD